MVFGTNPILNLIFFLSVTNLCYSHLTEGIQKESSKHCSTCFKCTFFVTVVSLSSSQVVSKVLCCQNGSDLSSSPETKLKDQILRNDNMKTIAQDQ